MTHSGPLALPPLTERDHACLGTLARVRVATTDQLYRLHFPGASRQAGYRCLWRLSRLGLVRRLERRIGGVLPGSSPAVYALDVKGQHLLEVSGPGGGERRQRPWTPSSPYLRHAVMVAETYVLTLEAVRDDDSWRLVDFQVEPACWRTLGNGYLKPDAFLMVQSEDYEDSYFLEVDLATESPAALSRKLSAYVEYYRSGQEQAHRGVFPRVLFLVPTEARKAQVQKLIDELRQERQLFTAALLTDLPAILLSEQ